MDLYDPEVYKQIASDLGYKNVLYQKGLDKLMKDSGFSKILSLARSLKEPKMASCGKKHNLTATAKAYRKKMKKPPLTKKAVNVKGGITSLALLASLMNPVKSFADDAMLAAIKMNANTYLPSVTKDVKKTIEHLGFFKRQGANMFGIDTIARNLAQAKANLEALKRYNINHPGAHSLHNKVTSLQNSIKATGDVDIGKASNIFDEVKKFNNEMSKKIKDMPGQFLAKR